MDVHVSWECRGTLSKVDSASFVGISDSVCMQWDVFSQAILSFFIGIIPFVFTRSGV